MPELNKTFEVVRTLSLNNGYRIKLAIISNQNFFIPENLMDGIKNVIYSLLLFRPRSTPEAIVEEIDKNFGGNLAAIEVLDRNGNGCIIIQN